MFKHMKTSASAFSAFLDRQMGKKGNNLRAMAANQRKAATFRRSKAARLLKSKCQRSQRWKQRSTRNMRRCHTVLASSAPRRTFINSWNIQPMLKFAQSQEAHAFFAKAFLSNCRNVLFGHLQKQDKQHLLSSILHATNGLFNVHL